MSSKKESSISERPQIKVKPSRNRLIATSETLSSINDDKKERPCFQSSRQILDTGNERRHYSENKKIPRLEETFSWTPNPSLEEKATIKYIASQSESLQDFLSKMKAFRDRPLQRPPNKVSSTFYYEPKTSCPTTKDIKNQQEKYRCCMPSASYSSYYSYSSPTFDCSVDAYIKANLQKPAKLETSTGFICANGRSSPQKLCNQKPVSSSSSTSTWAKKPCPESPVDVIIQHVRKLSLITRTPKPTWSERMPPQLIKEIIHSGRLRRIQTGKKETCAFCLNIGEKKEIYSSHCLMDTSSDLITCPIMSYYRCSICKTFGYETHTGKSCPYAEKEAKFRTKKPRSVLILPPTFKMERP